MTELGAVIHCNAGPGYGMGHLVRSLGIAEEAVSRGWRATIVGDISEVAREHAARIAPGVPVVSVPADGLAAGLEQAFAGGPDLVHFDTYWGIPVAPPSGAFVSNMQDGPFGVRPADLAIDANLGAEDAFERPELSRLRLIGLEAAVIRRQVLLRRDEPVASRVRPAVLVVLGGTDERRLTAGVVRALGGVDVPLDLTVVCPKDQLPIVEELARESPHSTRIEPFIDDLPAVARAQDLIVTAAGTSVWDFACLGAPMALLCVEENQERGYRASVEAGFGIPLGEPPHSGLAERLIGLGEELRDPERLRARGERLRGLVDGRGAWRIVSAWEDCLRGAGDRIAGVEASESSHPLVARQATSDDSRMLFEWRNDETTRANSRSTERVSWEGHTAWLGACLADPERSLLVIEDEGAGAAAERPEPVATVRWDRRGARDWEVSITVAPQHRGRGLARGILAAGEAALGAEGPLRLLAGIHESNAASRRLFAGAGYLPLLPADEHGFEMCSKWRLPR